MKPSQPLISVIVPAYNEEEQLPDCLLSLTHQNTSLPYEVIVVVYKSEDDTFKIAKSFDVRTILEKVRGRSYARQRGAIEAKGKYLAFTEADCVVPKDWIQSIYNYYKNNPQIIGFAGSYTYKNSSLLVKKLVPFSLALTSFLYKLLNGNYTFRGTNFSVKKEYLFLAGGFNHRVAPCDDVELGQRAGKLGQINFYPKIKVLTSDRRVKNRFFSFCLEFIKTYSRIFIFKKRGHYLLYEDIRN